MQTASASAGISYIYDKLGRLIAAVDLVGDTARYSYDEVGNLLSISRQPSSQVSIIEFTPGGGTVGASVTLFGTAFSTTPSQNSVAFNGTAATVTSSTATQIQTTVPAGATTGSIAVTSPSGSATSATPFTVSGSSGAPTITGFTPPIGTAGTAVTITGTNFETVATNNKTRFNIANALIISNTATSIATTVPSVKASSGPVSVATPAGKVVGADFFIPPSSYIASDVEVTGRMTIGTSTAVTISTANRIGLIVFDGVEGQRLSVYESHSFSQACESVRISVRKPDGIELAAAAGCFGSSLIEPQNLPMTGTYTLVVDPSGSLTGQTDVTLYNIVDITGSITPSGPPVNVNLTTPGQRSLHDFNGSVGQKVSAYATHSISQACDTAYLRLLKPDGTELAFAGGCFGNVFLDAQTLPVAGTYKLVLDPSGSHTGQGTLNLYNVVDVSGTVTIGGPAVNVSITTLGQNAELTFDGTANQQATVHITNNAIGDMTVKLLKPDGSVLTSVITGSFDLPTQTLPTTGTYKISVDPAGTRTGSMSVSVTSP